jgi:hypothetical protein
VLANLDVFELQNLVLSAVQTHHAAKVSFVIKPLVRQAYQGLKEEEREAVEKPNIDFFFVHRSFFFLFCGFLPFLLSAKLKLIETETDVHKPIQ